MKSVICYIPEELPQSDLNFICSDNKVHIRFRDFNTCTVVAGFEQKLTYLLTYLMNYSYLQKIILRHGDDELIRDFLQSSDVAEINACIRMESCNPKYKGIKLRKKYSKVKDSTYKPFGNVQLACFPVKVEDSIIRSGDLNFFLSAFKISLRDYLFNDNYIVIIDDIQTLKINKKFINKMIKKEAALTRSNLDIAELW